MENSSERYIRTRIAQSEKIDFAEYMELSLYHPAWGFYATGPRVGPDYFTSPSAHPVFGTSIAIQLNTMWQTLGKPETFYVIELGANDGSLGHDIKANVGRELGQALVYVAVDRVKPIESFTDIHSVVSSGLPFKSVVGCILSNEFIDALPFHRFYIEDGATKEIFVSSDSQEKLVDISGNPSTTLIDNYIKDIDRGLLEGFHGEWRPGISNWIKEVSELIECGYILTIDYGYDSLEHYTQSRKDGTIRGYQNHNHTNDIYRNIGGQDITADVDFEQILKLGEEADITTLRITDQSTFLRDNGFGHFLGQLRSMRLNELEKQANRVGMMELVRSPGLGDFKVMIQEKNTGVTDPDKLSANQHNMSELPLPLLGTHHVNLMESRYPHLTWTPQSYQWPFQ